MAVDPQQLHYTTTHEWVAVTPDSPLCVTVGMSDFAVRLLSDLRFIDLPPVGRQLAAGDSFCEIEHEKAVSDLYCPLSGTVIAINQQVLDNVDLLASEPFGAGWLIQLQLAEPANLGSLLNYAAYRQHCSGASRIEASEAGS